MNEQIWKYIAELSTPGFFVTADIMYEGEEFPVDIKAFIIDKLAQPANLRFIRADGVFILLFSRQTVLLTSVML
mgnify:CR=1 FL=1